MYALKHYVLPTMQYQVFQFSPTKRKLQVAESPIEGLPAVPSCEQCSKSLESKLIPILDGQVPQQTFDIFVDTIELISCHIR